MSSIFDSCPECGGIGSVECLECEPCPTCDGEGFIPPGEALHKQDACPTCCETGVICSNCDGSGQAQCQYCDGTGKIEI